VFSFLGLNGDENVIVNIPYDLLERQGGEANPWSVVKDSVFGSRFRK
jgi:hypothetical protein